MLILLMALDPSGYLAGFKKVFKIRGVLVKESESSEPPTRYSRSSGDLRVSSPCRGAACGPLIASRGCQQEMKEGVVIEREDVQPSLSPLPKSAQTRHVMMVSARRTPNERAAENSAGQKLVSRRDLKTRGGRKEPLQTKDGKRLVDRLELLLRLALPDSNRLEDIVHSQNDFCYDEDSLREYVEVSRRAPPHQARAATNHSEARLAPGRVPSEDEDQD
jgi:hypothetical protein